MNTARCLSLMLIGACLTLAIPSSALATGEPSTVKVRVEGPGGKTLLAQTEVATTTVPVPVQGGTCSGTSAGGALYDATHGNWKATLQPEGVEIDGIEGLNLPSFAENAYAYWAFWLNNEFAPLGACSEEVGAGADIVFVMQCYAAGAQCAESASAPDHFLTATAPPSRVLLVGETTSVTVSSVDTQTGSTETSLPAQASLSAGPQSVTPNSTGATTLTFPTAGTYTIQAKAPDSVPSDPYVVCVHVAGDGGCGTTAANTPGGGVAGFQQRYSGPFALAARSADPLDGHVYRRGHGPRLLSGTILSHEVVTSVSLELRRQYRGRCSAYDGTNERFLSARCGSGKSFGVAKGGSFSYLLPAALGPGRYVLDITAQDVAGNKTSLARGSSRIVFYVR
jgi:hypothetical protein